MGTVLFFSLLELKMLSSTLADLAWAVVYERLVDSMNLGSSFGGLFYS